MAIIFTQKWWYEHRANHKYCKRCGSELVTQHTGAKYDRHTGKALKVRTVVKCPKWTGIHFRAKDEHDYYSWENTINP